MRSRSDNLFLQIRRRLHVVAAAAVFLGIVLILFSYNWGEEVFIPDVATVLVSLGFAIAVVAELSRYFKSVKIAGVEIEMISFLQDQIADLTTKTAEARFAEVQKSSAVQHEGERPAPALGKPPALSVNIKNPDDPHQGRFGGRSEVDGFSLEALINVVGDGLAEIKIKVKGPKDRIGVGGVAEIYLHPTFRRDRVVVLFEDNRADYSFFAWGGFTVGVWLPRQEIELELDLARNPDAPHFIRML
ncbi:hypothetical protein AB7M35_002253 [Amorphus suaedae]